MFNYWTEGGFIAWAQQPAPNTGSTSLQLFIAGRAQAAYEPKDYKPWSNIMAGGQITDQKVQRVRARGQALTAADYKEIGNWMSEQLRNHNVWLVLMPANQFDKPSVRSLEYDPDWGLIFLNNKQKMFVDMRTAQSRKLFDGITNGKTLYPNDFSRDLIIAHYQLLPGKDKATHKQGLDLAIKAFDLEPSQAPLQKIMFAARFPELRLRVYNFCKGYVDDFIENKDSYAKKHGYHHKIVAALVAAGYLQRIASNQKDAEAAKFYAAKTQEYTNERRRMLKTKRW